MPAAPLLLSAATSLFAMTWLLAAAPFSVAVESAGFTVQSDGPRPGEEFPGFPLPRRSSPA
ncbi:hypothetical protein [Corallococcus aberystwythensis]|uniref:Uncharacterized protein n=1 Tax=Corallococcus aberystwythensis TaxID=2316722 RepID=A0A3A8PY07_9BACT|nr:hypothetical protein [Corallococcus aberystwythensis]RKH61329.1 hypothetical protein D7W81_24170 [Corallococcus aberystwythensis]